MQHEDAQKTAQDNDIEKQGNWRAQALLTGVTIGIFLGLVVKILSFLY